MVPVVPRTSYLQYKNSTTHVKDAGSSTRSYCTSRPTKSKLITWKISSIGHLREQFLQKLKGTWTTDTWISETSKGYGASTITQYRVFATIHKCWTKISVGS